MTEHVAFPGTGFSREEYDLGALVVAGGDFLNDVCADLGLQAGQIDAAGVGVRGDERGRRTGRRSRRRGEAGC